LKCFVYVLRSVPTGRFYTGVTGNLERRLREHNSKNGRWTSAGKPWVLLGFEEYLDRRAALARESFLKSWQGKDQRLRWFNSLVGRQSVG